MQFDDLLVFSVGLSPATFLTTPAGWVYHHRVFSNTIRGVYHQLRSWEFHRTFSWDARRFLSKCLADLSKCLADSRFWHTKTHENRWFEGIIMEIYWNILYIYIYICIHQIRLHMFFPNRMSVTNSDKNNVAHLQCKLCGFGQQERRVFAV